MRWVSRIAVMVFILAVTALILAKLPDVSEHYWNQEAGRQNKEDHVFLTQSNLVDHFISLELLLPLQRVEWSGELLIVDFQLTSIAQREQLYTDLYRLSEFAFSRTDNVNQLFVKVHAYLEGDHHLLLSMDARREQWNQQLPREDWLDLVLTYRG